MNFKFKILNLKPVVSQVEPSKPNVLIANFKICLFDIELKFKTCSEQGRTIENLKLERSACEL